MGISDAFTFDDVSAFQWADFAMQCRINKTFLVREMRRMATLVKKKVQTLDCATYNEGENEVIGQVRNLVFSQCDKMIQAAALIPGISEDDL
jgi:hypothetical protein